MKLSGKTLYIASAAAIVVLASSGCASKKYARTQAGNVNQRVTQIQTQTNGELAKHQSEISNLNERLTTTNGQVAAAWNAAQQANASATQASESAAQANSSAAQALQTAQNNSAEISSNTIQIQNNLTKMIDAQNYSLTDTGNVMFGVNKSELTDEAKVGLDLLVQKAMAQPRTVLEVEGFTDQTGSQSYNLILSQKRAEAVARYLVKQNVPLKSISLIGLGEETSPDQLAAEVLAVDPNASTKDIKGLARRVRIRVYAPGGAATSATAGSQDTGSTAVAGR